MSISILRKVWWAVDCEAQQFARPACHAVALPEPDHAGGIPSSRFCVFVLLNTELASKRLAVLVPQEPLCHVEHSDTSSGFYLCFVGRIVATLQSDQHQFMHHRCHRERTVLILMLAAMQCDVKTRGAKSNLHANIVHVHFLSLVCEPSQPTTLAVAWEGKVVQLH